MTSGGGRFGDDQTLWIERSVLESTPSEYDVLDSTLVVRRKVYLPPGYRVVGFGTRAIFVVRPERDGTESLLRYVRPW
jgi:hypothetical protein